MPLNKNIKIIINYLLGPLVFLVLFYSIYRQIQQQQHLEDSFRQIRTGALGPKQWRIWLALALMLVNWGLEARKWQISIRGLENISFPRAFQAVMTGVTIASFTPNRIGEYMGRMLYVQEGKRAESIALSIICSIAQLCITTIAGIGGIIYLRANSGILTLPDQRAFQVGLNALLFGTCFVMLIVAAFYFRIGGVVRLFERSGLAKYLQPVKILKNIKMSTLIHILVLSFVRYLVFILQYHLLFLAFGVMLTWGQTFAGISIMFLVMAVIPTFTFLTDLGLRWEASIQIIRLFNPDTTGIFAVSLGIWLMNLIIPALIGSLLILRIKLFRNK